MSVRRLWRLWALLLVAVVLAWLTLSPNAGDQPTLVAARQNARLPSLAPAPVPADPAPALALLSQSTLWGPLPPRAASGAAGGAPPDPQWAVTGYYELSGKRFVIVSFDQQALPSQQLSVGNRLPDGSRIAQIEPDRVRVWAPRAAAQADPAAAAVKQPGSWWLPITPGLPAQARRQ